MSFLKAQVSFPSNVASIFSSIKNNSSILFSAQTFYIYFGQKQPIKAQIFEIFECLGQNSSNSSCQFWTDKSILQFLHHSSLSWPITPLVNFKLIHFQLWTFKCFGESLPNFSCYFPNHKSMFLRILHHSLVSWKITPQYFFSSNIMYFGQMQPIKV